eukprot:994355-Amphidinium_carterae.1
MTTIGRKLLIHSAITSRVVRSHCVTYGLWEGQNTRQARYRLAMQNMFGAGTICSIALVPWHQRRAL